MNTGQPSPLQPDSDGQELRDEETPGNAEMLDSLLHETKRVVDDRGYHALLTEYVREHRLASKFDFDNLTELVRCIVNQTKMDQLPVDKEDAITWIANCFYEDPVACERVELLWNSIVSRMHDHD